MKQVNCAACRQRITLRYGEGSCIFRASWCNFGINEAQLSQTNWGVREFYRQKRVSWTNGVNIQGVRNRWQKSMFSGKIPTYRVYRITDRCIYIYIYIYVQKQCRQKFTCPGKYRQAYRMFEIAADKNTGVHKKYWQKYTCLRKISAEIHVSGNHTYRNTCIRGSYR
jgi:hypothetical protein